MRQLMDLICDVSAMPVDPHRQGLAMALNELRRGMFMSNQSGCNVMGCWISPERAPIVEAILLRELARWPAPENPPAFPTPNLNGGMAGMSLRDYFAGQALLGLAMRDGIGMGDAPRAGLATWAYAMADAMIAARPHGESG